MGALLARDDKQSILQVGSYDTANYTNVASGGSIGPFVYDAIIRVKSYGGDNWITRSDDDTAAIDSVGLLLEAGEEITMLVFKGEYITTIGGSLNIVPVAK